MGSLNNGQPISHNTYRHHHIGTELRRSNYVADTGVVVSNSGVIRVTNYVWPFAIEHVPTGVGGEFVSGISLGQRELEFHPSGSGIQYLDYLTQSSGLTLQHKITRAMGLHTSTSTRHKTGESGMLTVRERKVFWTDTDRNDPSNPSAWTIFDANGDAVGADEGVTTIDVAPLAKFSGLPS